MRKLFYINAVSGVGQVMVNSILLIITIPVFIKTLGIESYGLFSLIYVLNGVGSLASFGFSISLLKYLSEQGRSDESRYDIVVTGTFLLTISLGMALILTLLGEFVLHSVFGIDLSYLDQNIIQFYNYIVWTNIFLIMGQIPTAMLDSLQKVYISNALQAVQNILTRGFMLIVLWNKPSMANIGESIFLATIVWFILTCTAAIASWGALPLRGVFPHFGRIVWKHGVYGGKIFTTSVFGLMYEPLTKIMINAFIGIQEVAFFEIALRLKGFVWSVGERLLYPLTPVLAATEDPKQITRYLMLFEHLIMIMAIPVVITVNFVIGDILELWLHNGNSLLVGTTSLIVSIYLIALTVVPTYYYLNIKNKPGKAMVLQFSNVVVNTILFFIVVPFAGYWGAVIAFCSSIVVSFVLSLYYNKKYLGSFLLNELGHWTEIALTIGYLIVSNTILSVLFTKNIYHLSVILVNSSVVSAILFLRIDLVRNNIQLMFSKK